MKKGIGMPENQATGSAIFNRLNKIYFGGAEG